MMSPLAIILITLIIFAIVVFFTFSWLRRIARARESALRERFPAAKHILSGVNFFGQESKGLAQMRGNGTLVLTDAELYFERWLPRAEYRIAIADIQAVETTNRFLGKIVYGRLLVKVVYRNAAGQPDAMAWLARDSENLKRMIDGLLHKSA